MEPVAWYAVTAILLFLKMSAISVYQGYHRIGRRTFRIPEDAAWAGQAPVAEDLPKVVRAQNAWRNDVENIPIFLALAVAYVWVEASPSAMPWLFLGFTAARCLHTYCYLRALQPWRSVAHAVGLLCVFVMCGLILAALPPGSG